MVCPPWRTRKASCPVACVSAALAVLALLAILAVGPAAAQGDPRCRAVVVPRAEAQMFRLVNAERRAARVAPLRVAPRLRAFARRTSGSIARGAPFAHSSLHWARGRSAGQNLARTAGAPSAVSMMLESESHRRNLLQPTWRSMGIGAARDCSGTIVFTLNFFSGARA